MILYLDTSALVKRYIQEAGTDEVIALLESAESVGSASLTKVEMAAAFEKTVRQGWVKRKIAMQAWQDFLDHWSSFTRLNTSSGSIDRASALAWEYGLRGYDAVHLACALLWKETLETQITMATFDRDLWQASKKAVLAVWPEALVS
jgi:predicted nucleic acid-binding protein